MSIINPEVVQTIIQAIKPILVDPNRFYRTYQVYDIYAIKKDFFKQLQNEGIMPEWEQPYLGHDVFGYSGQTIIETSQKIFSEMKARQKTVKPRRGRPPLKAEPAKN